MLASGAARFDDDDDMLHRRVRTVESFVSVPVSMKYVICALYLPLRIAEAKRRWTIEIGEASFVPETEFHRSSNSPAIALEDLVGWFSA